MAFECQTCRKSFSRLSSLKRHMLLCGNNTLVKHDCPNCDKKFSRLDDVMRHIKQGHGTTLTETQSIVPYTIVGDQQQISKKFKVTRRNVIFKLNEPPKNKDVSSWLRQGIEGVVNHIIAKVKPYAKVGFTFSTEDDSKESYISFKRADQITYDDVWSMVANIYQSNSEGLNTDKFRLGATLIDIPRGKGFRRSANYFSNYEEECRQRQGIITINNKDHLCLARALVVAIAKLNKDAQFPDIRKDTRKLQLTKALELMNAAGVTIPKEGGSIEHVQLFQRYLHYKIIVYEYGTRNVIFEGPSYYSSRNIHLLYHEGHYNVITSLTAAFGSSYFCDLCHVSYNDRQKHRCKNTCPCCLETPPCEKELDVKCAECNRNFRGQNCFNNHLLKKICNKIRQCSVCFKTVKKNRQHRCGEIFCKICRSHQIENHLCYIQPDNKQAYSDGILYVFYDLETRQEAVSIDGSRLHEPNLCVFQQRCSDCLYEDILLCKRCGIRQHVLNKNPVEIFLQHVFNQSKIFNKVVVIAHNGQAFDHQFLLKYIIENTKHTPTLIMRGSKIILMEIATKIKFIDSLNYFPMALAMLPKVFDLPSTYKKGYFPHLFNTLKNQNYIGPMPNMEFYDPDGMKPSVREDFLKWYKQHLDDRFDFQSEFVSYCVSDVQILAESCIKFRQMMIIECNVDPFLEATTIASACNLVFRRNFLKQHSIGVIPRNGYRYSDNQSPVAIKWLIWESQQRGILIKHALNGKEVIINGVKVDGYCEETKQIFEFHGCYYHGHICQSASRDAPLHDDTTDTLNRRFERTTVKTKRLRAMGYEVNEMWECQLPKHVSEFTHPLLNCIPLNPRDAFYGGRTGNTVLKYEVKAGEKIKYLDVCSLYPWVCKYGKFPVGHPNVCIEPTKSTPLKDGLIKCKILPPQNIFHPVLPVKMNNKLLFPLCRTCASSLNQVHCTHNKEERALIGTFVVDEVIKAVEMGYEILEIFETWDYAIEQYSTKCNGLFTAFINKFLKMKQQASGWPPNCFTEHEKRKYIEDFFLQEGIDLEFHKISKNEGLRALAKLMLNSFWGKFGQRENQTKTAVIREPKEFFSLLCNPSIDVNTVTEINDDVIIVNYILKEEAHDSLATVNVAIAAYTTAQARLKLYGYLEKLQERVLYYDTDSIIYISRNGEYDPPTGSMLGDLTDELECYGADSFITTFVSTGPKCYAYSVFSPTKNAFYNTCKVKGITLNYQTTKQINLESMSKMVDNGEPILTVSTKILRTQNHEVITKTVPKVLQITSRKRKFFDDNTSVPYGYKKT